MSVRIVTVSGPAGVGKTTSLRLLSDASDNYLYLVSLVTRRRRSGEKRGEYRFVSHKRFERSFTAGKLLWRKKTRGNYYGLQKGSVDAIMGSDTTVGIVALTPDTVRRLRNYLRKVYPAQYPSAIYSFYITAPRSLLRHRLLERKNAIGEIAVALGQKRRWDRVAREGGRGLFDEVLRVRDKTLPESVARVIQQRLLRP
jgi:guanylate kinase